MHFLYTMLMCRFDVCVEAARFSMFRLMKVDELKEAWRVEVVIELGNNLGIALGVDHPEADNSSPPNLVIG